MPSFEPTQLIDLLKTSLPSQRGWIAYSGGLDSHVLLFALAQLRAYFPSHDWHAIHIHHGLNPKADQWVEHCLQQCRQLDISCEIIRVRVNMAKGESLEAQARLARYQAFSQKMVDNDVIFTAHHVDDQVETVLLQLLRGAGVAGLAAMPMLNRLGIGWLLRPLLGYTRDQLYQYAQQHRLQWIEDSSNSDLHFDRNFLRHDIIPRLKHRWPGLCQSINRAAHHQAQAHELLSMLAEQDLGGCLGTTADQLSIIPLSQLPPARQSNLLRYWLKKLNLPTPSTVKIQQILTTLLTAQPDRQPVVKWSGAEVRRYQQALYAMPNLPPIPAAHSFTWQPPSTLTLPLGRLTAKLSCGMGLVIPADRLLNVRFRQGGEQIRLQNHQRVVKKLLQDLQIPTWQRQFIPLIYLDNILIAIPMIGVSDKWKAKENQLGWELEWDLTDWSAKL